MISTLLLVDVVLLRLDLTSTGPLVRRSALLERLKEHRELSLSAPLLGLRPPHR
jgi:hypothetical protein